MNRKEVIDILKMENELMTYDPRSGEDFSPECLNDIDKKCYDAHIEAIKLLEGDIFETFCGVPIDEAVRIIEVYKYTHNIPSEDYIDGFKKGAEYMRTQYKKAIDEQLKNLMGKGEEKCR